MRWSEAGYLSQFVLSHALRQVSASLILCVRQNYERTSLHLRNSPGCALSASRMRACTHAVRAAENYSGVACTSRT